MPAGLLAITSWTIMIAVSIGIRKKHPILLFSVTWFLFGHLLESSLFPLELYFEHRNYIPSFGVIFGIVLTFWLAIPRIAPHIASLTSVIFAVLLVRITTLWGDPYVSAETWHNAHPLSPRAAQHFAKIQMEQGYNQEGLRTLEVSSARIPLAGDLALQIMQAECALDGNPINIRNQYDKIIQNTHIYEASTAISNATGRLLEFNTEGRCAEISLDDIQNLIYSLLDNRKIKRYYSIAHELHQQLSLIFRKKKQLNPTIVHLEKAYAIKPELTTVIIIASTLASAGLYSEALDRLENGINHHTSIMARQDKHIQAAKDLHDAIRNISPHIL